MRYRKIDKTKLYDNGFLNDALVLSEIDKAKALYEDGAIIEAKFILSDIVEAIQDFIDAN